MMDVCDMYVFLRRGVCVFRGTHFQGSGEGGRLCDRVKPGAVGLMRVSECTLRRLDR